jgi:hypothetical protein
MRNGTSDAGRARIVQSGSSAVSCSSLGKSPQSKASLAGSSRG